MSTQENNGGHKELLSVSDAARYLGVSPSTVRRWDKENKLTSVRTPGGHRRFSVDELKTLYKPSRPGITFS